MRHPTAQDVERAERCTHKHHADTFLQRSSRMTVPISFHVLIGDGGKGNISTSEIDHQVQVLNKAYSNSNTASGVDTNIRFGPVSISKYVNNSWYDLCSTYDRAIASELTTEVEVAVNIFSCSGEGLLGWATGFPWEFNESDRSQAIFISADTMTINGPLSPTYDKGVTLVHEMGHYLGLFHSFHGGCSDPGDSISDTPAQRYPTYGACEDNQGKDTCSGPGRDDISNFMDYSDDDCMDHFSPQQVDRMHDILTTYRPTMVNHALVSGVSSSLSAPVSIVAADDQQENHDQPSLEPFQSSPSPSPSPTASAGETESMIWNFLTWFFTILMTGLRLRIGSNS